MHAVGEQARIERIEVVEDVESDRVRERGHYQPPTNRPGPSRPSGSNCALIRAIRSSPGTGPNMSTVELCSGVPRSSCTVPPSAANGRRRLASSSASSPVLVVSGTPMVKCPDGERSADDEGASSVARLICLERRTAASPGAKVDLQDGRLQGAIPTSSAARLRDGRPRASTSDDKISATAAARRLGTLDRPSTSTASVEVPPSRLYSIAATSRFDCATALRPQRSCSAEARRSDGARFGAGSDGAERCTR